MRRWWLVIALLLSVGLNLGILAAVAVRRGVSRPPDRSPRPEIANPGGDPLPRLPRLADRLGLEGEKRRQFLDIQMKLFQETSRLRLQLGEVHREIRREMTRPEPDRQRVDRLLNESARIYLALERSLVANVFSTRELLDREQEQEYLALIGRLRVVPNPGAGLGGPGPARQTEPRPGRLQPADPQRPRPPTQEMRRQMLEERMRRQRLWEERRRQRMPGRRFPPRRPRRFEEETPPEPEPPTSSLPSPPPSPP